MDTKLVTHFTLKPATPEEVILTLQFMVDQEQGITTPSHPLFQTKRWYMLLCGPSTKFYYDGISFQLESQTELRNYDEIRLFWEWIAPYIDALPGEHLGHTQHEEDDYPTNIQFAHNGTLEYGVSDRHEQRNS